MTGRELWQSFWGPFNKKDPAGMHNALRKYWNREAERHNAGEPPVELAIFAGDPISLAIEHGSHRIGIDSPWNEEGFAPPDPNHKKKAVNPT